jgi:hypothetical protein
MWNSWPCTPHARRNARGRQKRFCDSALYPLSLQNVYIANATFSPLALAFLVVAEALTRLIQSEDDIKKSTANTSNSQFARDTQLVAETYENMQKALKYVAMYERATGGKVSAHKYVGIQ